MAVQRHSLFQNNLIDVIINSKTWASAQQRLVVKVGFIMLTFGKPTCRSHFWMRSSSSVFFTALSPMKHVSWFTFFLHFLVGGKHGGVKSSKPKVGQRQIEKLSKCKTTNLVKTSQAHTYNQLLSVVVTPHMFCSVAWCVWKNTQIKRSEPSVSISNSNGEKSFHPWAETSGERTKWDYFLINL